MWIVAKHGFISLVEDRKDSYRLIARARVREDLERFFPDYVEEIIEDEKADYLYRVPVPRDEVIAVVVEQLTELHYDSHVKEELTTGRADERIRYTAYMDTWQAMLRMQPKPSAFGGGVGSVPTSTTYWGDDVDDGDIDFCDECGDEIEYSAEDAAWYHVWPQSVEMQEHDARPETPTSDRDEEEDDEDDDNVVKLPTTANALAEALNEVKKTLKE